MIQDMITALMMVELFAMFVLGFIVASFIWVRIIDKYTIEPYKHPRWLWRWRFSKVRLSEQKGG